MLPLLAKSSAASGLAQNKWTPIVMGVIVVGVGIGGYFLVKRGLCAVGLATCRSDRKLARLQAKFKKEEALNPNYYQAPRLTITHNLAKVKADELNSALWGADDEDAVYAILRSAKTKDNMSLISKYYALRHDQSLSDNLGYEMGSEEEIERMLEVLKY